MRRQQFQIVFDRKQFLKLPLKLRRMVLRRMAKQGAPPLPYYWNVQVVSGCRSTFEARGRSDIGSLLLSIHSAILEGEKAGVPVNSVRITRETRLP